MPKVRFKAVRCINCIKGSAGRPRLGVRAAFSLQVEHQRRDTTACKPAGLAALDSTFAQKPRFQPNQSWPQIQSLALLTLIYLFTTVYNLAKLLTPPAKHIIWAFSRQVLLGKANFLLASGARKRKREP